MKGVTEFTGGYRLDDPFAFLQSVSRFKPESWDTGTRSLVWRSCMAILDILRIEALGFPLDVSWLTEDQVTEIKALLVEMHDSDCLINPWDSERDRSFQVWHYRIEDILKRLGILTQPPGV